jgi:hypothetical protein
MARPSNQSDHWDYTVESVKLLTPEGRESGWLGNQRTDTGEVIGISTEHYGIVNNRDVIAKADEAIEARGLVPKTKEIVVSDNGAKMRALYDFSDTIKSKVPEVGDEMGFRLVINNSFDRSLRLSFALGLVRLVCTNGMTTLEKEFDLTKKHSKSINIDDLLTADKLSTALDSFDSSLDVYARLARTEVTQEQGLNVLQNLTKANVISEKLREPIARIWNDPTHAEDSDRNLYNLNNAVTQHLTTDVAADRFEYANRITGQVLNRFEKASKNSKRLAALVKAIPVELN